MPENPPAPTVPTTPISPPVSPESSSFFRTLLIGLALILLGTFIGVLAARFAPMPSDTILPLPDNSLTPTVTEEIIAPTVEITPIPEPTATPAALLNLKWNMMTVKSPLTTFSDYKIYYPTTWSIREYKNTTKADDAGNSILTLVKGSTILTIRQASSASIPCLFAGENNPSGSQENFGEFQEIDKSVSTVWRMGLSMDNQDNTWTVCEKNAGESFVSNTTIGNITISKTNVDTVDEAKYILEKIVILPNTR